MSTPEDATMPLDGTPGEGLGPRLLVLTDGQVTTHALPRAGQLVLGRAPDADIRIDRESISRRHAILHVGERVEIEDVGSSNGTRLGGRRLEPGLRIALEAGDVLELGGTSVLLQGALASPSPAPRPRADMDHVVDMALRVARSEISVLLLGETGVGKEVLARRIHAASARAGHAFVAINCGALPESILESELFGHEAGAFTGAQRSKPGLLETGERGTVFLDEVGELPLAAQVKLLRVLEDRRVLRVGGLVPRPIDVRFLAATHRDLRREVAEGRFREDLYYRLNGITLAIPPLRERVAEIPRLAAQFLEEAVARVGSGTRSISKPALDRLEAHPWPGNIRELRNVIERAVVLHPDGPIAPEHLFADLAGPPGPATMARPTAPTDHDDERSRILTALQQCAGNQTRAAKLLGISRRTLGVKLDAFGIARPQKGQR